MSRKAARLDFQSRQVVATFTDPDGRLREAPIEIRTDPVSGRTARITFARADEKEPGAEALPEPPPSARDTDACPFCPPQINDRTPRFPNGFISERRLIQGASVLFPNLFPYGTHSAVSLVGKDHFTEIGTANRDDYTDSLINAQRYLKRVLEKTPGAVHMAITQNHLPSAGGSLVHPHLQVHADPVVPNHLRFLHRRTHEYARQTGRLLFSDYLAEETARAERLIGTSGDWHWLAAFAPEGFFEIWAILPRVFSMQAVTPSQWQDLAAGIINTQKFYRSRNRNGYNLGLLAVETEASCLELRARLVVRANYTPWARNDHTGYELMLGDMATFVPPEQTAAAARPFWPEMP